MFDISVKKYDLMRIIFYIISTIFIGYSHINHLEFFLITITLISIFVIAKFSYYTIFSFILWFSFLQEYIATINPALASGRLMAGLGIPVYDQELFICTMFFFIFELIVFATTQVINSEKEIYKRKLIIKKEIAYLLGIVAFGLVIMAYPSMPSFGATLGRDKGIVPSSLVVPLAMLLLAVIFDNLKYGLFLKCITVLTLVWVLFHGDRVIVMGYVIYVILKYMNDGRFNFNTLKSIIFNKRTLVVAIGVVVIAALAIRIQTTRMGSNYSLNISDLMMNIIKQGTAGDVVYSFNCSVHMWKHGNCVGGYSYLYYLANILPGANSDYYSAMILMNEYNSLGGGLIFVEPMINGGIFHTFIYSIIFILLITWIYCKENRYHALLVISICILVFRFEWYATCAGLVKMFLYYVPFTYFVIKKFSRYGE